MRKYTFVVLCLSLCKCTHHSYFTILYCYDLIVDLSCILVLSSGRRSWPIMMASRRSLCPCGLHVLVYRVVVPCYDFLSSWSTQYQLSCAIMSSQLDMLSSRNYHYTTDSSLVALVLTQIRLRVVPMAQEYQLRYGEQIKHHPRMPCWYPTVH